MHLKGAYKFMDTVKIGKFIAELRRGKNLTQEELGEKLGVTNKTISRWENGNYMPGIEMLQMMSKEFGVSINELLTGEKIDDENYREAADKNIADALADKEASKFSLKERCDFWRKKWKRDHLAEIIMWCVLVIAVYIAGFCFDKYLISAADCIFGIWLYFKKRNQMMAYIEQRAFDGSGK